MSAHLVVGRAPEQIDLQPRACCKARHGLREIIGDPRGAGLGTRSQSVTKRWSAPAREYPPLCTMVRIRNWVVKGRRKIVRCSPVSCALVGCRAVNFPSGTRASAF